MSQSPPLGQSLWKDAQGRLLKNRAAMLSLCIIIMMLFACFILPLFELIAPPNATNLEQINAASSWTHLMGTDQLGRDLLSRVLYGGRISLLVAAVATSVSLLIGLIYGMIAGYVGGRTDAFMMRVVDTLFALPFIVLVIVFSLSIEEPSRELTNWIVECTSWSHESVAPITGLVPLFIAIGALGWLTLARIVRTQSMEISSQEYILAARSLGLSHTRIILRHIAPNLLGTVIIYTTLAVPAIILTESTLSFIGLGVKAPNASWGTLIKEGADRMELTPSLLLYPAFFFSLTLLALNILGDGLRDALDPRSKD